MEFKRPWPSTSTTTSVALSTAATSSTSSSVSMVLLGRLQLMDEKGRVVQDVPLHNPDGTEQASFVVGRCRGVALCIPHVQVSRKHAQINYNGKDQRWTLLDTGSSNGVYVDKRRLAKHESLDINTESEIKLGPTDAFKVRLITSDDPECSVKRRRTHSNVLNDDPMQELSVSSDTTVPESSETVRKANIVSHVAQENNIHDNVDLGNNNVTSSISKGSDHSFDFLRPEVPMDTRRPSIDVMNNRDSVLRESTNKRSTMLAMSASSCPLLGHVNNLSLSPPRFEPSENNADYNESHENMAAISVILNTPFGDEDVANDESRVEDTNENVCSSQESVASAEEKTQSDVESSSNATLASKMKTKISSELSCTICNEIFIKPLSLPCGHVFCSFCLSQWKKKSSNAQFVCPNCRYKVGREKINPNIYIANLIDSLVEEIGGELKKSFEAAVASREEDELEEKRIQEEKEKVSKSRSGRGRSRRGAGSTRRTTTSARSTTSTRGVVTPTTVGGTRHQSSSTSSRSIRNYMVGGTNSDTSPTSSVSNRSSRRRGTSRSVTTAVITIDDGNSDEDDDDDDDDEEENDSDDRYSDSDYAEGDPDANYGGYGRCFNCGNDPSEIICLGRRGHWAEGCPSSVW